jgi:hypothetical protein
MNRLLSGAIAVSLMFLASAASAQFIPPPCTFPGPFADVPDTHPFCAWIQQLANDQITAGCGGGKYCPDSSVTRAQMAVFLERAMRGTAAWNPDAARKYYLTTSFVNGAAALGACSADYHMASLFEIIDTSHLRYETSLGSTTADSGSGPPELTGWIRTGNTASVANVAGQANCNGWASSANGDRGTAAFLTTDWTASATVRSPWSAGPLPCDSPTRVWCVQD